MIGIFIALLSGALMSIQGVWNTGVTKQSGVWTAAGWVQLSAFVVCVFMWLFGERQAISSLWQVQPKYLLLGGVLGAFITYTVIRSVDQLGPAQSALLIVIAQIVVAYGIELAGLFGVDKADFEWRKLIGTIVAVIGIVIFKK